MVRFRILVLLSVVAILGCGGDRAVDVTPPPTLPAAESAKALLTEIAESGEVGSGAMELRENLEKLNQQGLVADLDALEGMTDATQIKAKANEILGKLGAAAPGPAAE